MRDILNSFQLGKLLCLMSLTAQEINSNPVRPGMNKFPWNGSANSSLVLMDSTAELQVTLEQITKTQELVADEVEKVFALKSAHLNAEKEETKLRELCARLASHRAKFVSMVASVKAYRLPERLLQETADIGGPRWRIGWGGLV